MKDPLFFGGAQLAVMPIVKGAIEADGKDTQWDDGYRVELHFRDYYFRQQHHHPFAELGLFYESHDMSRTVFEVQSETIALSGAVGSAIPLWRAVDDSMVVGMTSELDVHIGALWLDAEANDQRSDDQVFRYGASAGISGWMAFNRAFSIGLGVVGTYWRATSMTLTVPDGVGTTERRDTPTGWDLGVRLAVGFMF